MSVISTLHTLDIKHKQLSTVPDWPLVHFATHQSGNDVFVTASMEVRVTNSETVAYSAPGQCVREALHNLAKIIEAVGDTVKVVPSVAHLGFSTEFTHRPNMTGLAVLGGHVWFHELSKRMLTLSFQEEEELGLEEV